MPERSPVLASPKVELRRAVQDVADLGPVARGSRAEDGDAGAVGEGGGDEEVLVADPAHARVRVEARDDRVGVRSSVPLRPTACGVCRSDGDTVDRVVWLDHVAPTETPCFGRPRRSRASEVDGRRLDGGAGGHQLVVRWHPSGATDEVGDDAPVGRAVGRAADEEHRPVGAFGAERIGPGEEVADHTFDGGAGQLAGVTSVRKSA